MLTEQLRLLKRSTTNAAIQTPPLLNFRAARLAMAAPSLVVVVAALFLHGRPKQYGGLTPYKIDFPPGHGEGFVGTISSMARPSGTTGQPPSSASAYRARTARDPDNAGELTLSCSYDLRLRKRSCSRATGQKNGKNKASETSLMRAFQQLPVPESICDFKLPDFIRERKAQAAVYTHIKRNIYMVKKTRKKEDEGIECSCRGSKVCSTGCICKMLYTSCSANCGCGDGCINLPFQRRPRPKLKVVKTENCGWGLVAEANIKAGDFLIEYVGEVIDDKTCEERLWAMKARGECNFYLCEINRNMVIDATFKGNVSRFINHSCQPNAQLRKWQCDGELRIGVFAMKSIAVGEEITYDYQYIQFGTEQVCRCGSAKCRGVLGSKPGKQPASKALYEGGSATRPKNGIIAMFPRRKRTDVRCKRENVLGNRVRVWWPLDQKYYSGVIARYDPVLGKHQILYDDGQEEEVLLRKERWTWEANSQVRT